MSFIDFGEELLTQPSLGMSHRNASQLLNFFDSLSWRIAAISDRIVTIYLGGGAAAVLNGACPRANSMTFFVATTFETWLVAEAGDNLVQDDEFRSVFSDRTLQDQVDAMPQIKQILVDDARDIEPVYYRRGVLKVVVPRWEIPYAVKLHELAFDEQQDRVLGWMPSLMVCYLQAYTESPTTGCILESSVQDDVRDLYPEEKSLGVRE
ncbi:hypothetical protein Daus18300_011095 [Diaporthe australafricana]|uniref:Uncharacterized protein n=1 Tax=Diaporthe australafricana TaxID=127596 RepID=A0ABR3W7X7_9PEZI